MRPTSWLESISLQRRIARLLLGRLTFLSPVELENIEISWGSSSRILLRDVSINTENITLPHLEIDNGTIRSLELLVPSNPLWTSLELNVSGLRLQLSRSFREVSQSIILEEDAPQLGFTDFQQLTDTLLRSAFESLIVNVSDVTVAFEGLLFEVAHIHYASGKAQCSGIRLYTGTLDDTSTDSENENLQQSAMFTSANASSLYKSALVPPLINLEHLGFEKVMRLVDFIRTFGAESPTKAAAQRTINLQVKIHGLDLNYGLYHLKVRHLSATEQSFEFEELEFSYTGLSATISRLTIAKSFATWNAIIAGSMINLPTCSISINGPGGTYSVSLPPLIVTYSSEKWLLTLSNISIDKLFIIRKVAVDYASDANVENYTTLLKGLRKSLVKICIGQIEARISKRDLQRLRPLHDDLLHLADKQSVHGRRAEKDSLLIIARITSLSARVAESFVTFQSFEVVNARSIVFHLTQFALRYKSLQCISSKSNASISGSVQLAPFSLKVALSCVCFQYHKDILQLLPTSSEDSGLFKGEIQIGLTDVDVTLHSREDAKLKLLVNDAGFALQGANIVRGNIEARKLHVELIREADIAKIAIISNLGVSLLVKMNKTNIDVRGGFIILETCADSTQTAIAACIGLLPEKLASPIQRRYRMESSTVSNLFEGLDDDAFTPKSKPRKKSDEGSFEFVHKSESSSEDTSLMELSDEIILAESMVDLASAKQKLAPFQVHVREIYLIWNLHDGFDWSPVREVVDKVIERQKANEVVGDFLFNSIYIDVPPKMEEGPPVRVETTRSVQHKVQIEVSDVSADFLMYKGAGEILSSLSLRVKNANIIDNIPTSTWKKFVAYDASYERREDSSLISVEVLNVRPVATLGASEAVVHIKILPLRLHVDQDTLDFLTRFFEFENSDDERVSEPVFFQRVEVEAVKIKLDYKPKKVDYAGLRSGHTTGFMNFFILDDANFVLRHTVLYGVPSVPRIVHLLNNIWLPDIRSTQVGNVIAGMAPMRSLVTLGGGVRDLILVPVKEYKKDGNVAKSIRTGANQFWKTTSNELVRLGAKVAAGTQVFLEGAEGILLGETAPEVPTEAVSLYADQPLNVVQGLQRAYASLTKNLATAHRSMRQVPEQVRGRGTATGAASAIAKAAPTIVIRPLIGASEAVRETLMGVTNAINPEERRRIEEKYKTRISSD